MRKYLLLPINGAVLWYTYKYSGGFSSAFRRKIMPTVVPGGRKYFTSLFAVATVQAVFMTTLLVGVNCGVLGINPFAIYTRHKQMKKLSNDEVNNMIVSDSKVIPGLPPGTRYQDLPEDLRDLMYDQSATTIILLDLVKFLGLSDTTAEIIEQDLRN